MIKFFKRVWVEFWWGKPVETTPVQKKQIERAHQNARIAQIKHKRKHKKRVTK